MTEPNELEDYEEEDYEPDEPDYEAILDSYDYNYGDQDEPELFPYAEPY